MKINISLKQLGRVQTIDFTVAKLVMAQQRFHY